MKNKLNCLKSRRSLKAVAADTLIIFDNSCGGFDAKYLTHDKLIQPMRWTFCTYHEERREKYQLWIFLLLISTKVNKINPLFQREHMCTKCQILSETSYTEWSKGRYTPGCVSKLPSKGLTIEYTVIVDLAPLTIAEWFE